MQELTTAKDDVIEKAYCFNIFMHRQRHVSSEISDGCGDASPAEKAWAG